MPASALKITESEKVHVPRFLNRLLGLAPSAQKMLFDFFQVRLLGFPGLGCASLSAVPSHARDK